MGKKETHAVGEKALKAGAWYVVSSVLVKGIAVLTTPIFARILSTVEYGNVATFTSWYSIFSIFCTADLYYSIGRAKQDFPGKLDRYIGSMTALSAIISSVIVAIGLLFLKPLSSFMELSEPLMGLLLAYLFFAPAILFAQNSYRYRYKYKQNIAIALYTALSTVAASLIFIAAFKENKDVLRVIGIVLPTIVLSLFFWSTMIKNKNLCLDKEYCHYGLAISVPLIMHSLSLNILAQSDRIFITKLWGPSYTAIYSLTYSYGLLIFIILNAISESWLPWFHDTYFAGDLGQIRKNVKPLILLGCYMGLACIALAPEAIAVLGGEKYAEGIYCVPPIVLGVLCQYVYTHYVNIELHLKKTKYISMATVLAAILNIVLNALFIPHFGFIAAAYTTLTGYILLLLLHCFITRKILKVQLYNDKFMIGVIPCTAAISFAIVKSYNFTLLRYAMILVGAVSFLLVFRGFISAFVQNKLRKNG